MRPKDVEQDVKILTEGFIVSVVKATVCIVEQYAEVCSSVRTLVMNSMSYTLWLVFCGQKGDNRKISSVVLI